MQSSCLQNLKSWPTPSVVNVPEARSIRPSLHSAVCWAVLAHGTMPHQNGFGTSSCGNINRHQQWRENRWNQLNQPVGFFEKPSLDRHLFRFVNAINCQPKTLLKQAPAHEFMSPTSYETVVWRIVPKQDSHVLCSFGHVRSHVGGTIFGRGMTSSPKAMQQPPLSACAQMRSLFDEALTTPCKQARLKMTDPSHWKYCS